MSSPITILSSSDGKLATKRWYRAADGNVVNSTYEKAYQFRADVYQVKDIRDFYKAMKWLEPQPTCFVVRGVPTDGVDRSKPVLRRSNPDTSGHVWFEEYAGGLSWVMLDFDKIFIPAGIDVNTEPEEAIEYLVGLLPEPFWDASCVWQLSSSAGMGNDDLISAHLVFWLNRPVLNAELKAWASQVNAAVGYKLIDPALFQTVQPHYTATPIFDGVFNPIQRRSGFREGLEDEVAFPKIVRQEHIYTGSSGGVLQHAQGFDAKLKYLGDGTGLEGFHAPLREATASYVGTHGTTGTDSEALKSRLREAIIAAPKGLDRNVSRYLSDEYLDDIIRSAIQKFGGSRVEQTGDLSIEPYYPPITEPKAHALVRQKSVINSWGVQVQRNITIRRNYQTERTEAHERIDLDDSIENQAAAKAVVTRKLRAKYRKEFRQGAPDCQRLAITGSQGSGKTSEGLKAVAAMRDGIIVVLVPTLAKAEEVHSDYIKLCTEQSLPSMIMRGRGAPSATQELMCVRGDLAERVANAGLRVTQTLCNSERSGTCPYFSDCLYQAELCQLRKMRDDGRGIIFAAHQYVFSTSILPIPDAVIIDESIVLKATTTTSFAPDRITEIGNSWERVGADIGADYVVLSQRIRAAIESGQPILKALRDAGITDDDLTTCVKFTEAVETKELHGVGPGSSDARIDVALSRIEASEVTNTATLFHQLKLEYDFPRGQANGVTFDPNAKVQINDKAERQGRVKVHSLLTPQLQSHDFLDKAPLLLLDGTGNIDLICRVFGRNVEHHHIPMERLAEVTQVHGHFAADQITTTFATMTFSRQSMTGKDRFGVSLGQDREIAAEKRRSEIAEFINGLPGDVFVGGTKKVVSGDKDHPGVLNSLLGPNCETGHYNAVRGLNIYEHCETAVIVGREQPSAEALEDIARCFAGSDAAPFISTKDNNGNCSYVLQCRGHRLRDGSGHAELVEVHPDSLAQSILEQIRETEILQTIDRVRAIFNIRRIIILTSVVLDITVDWLLPWKDLKARFVLEREFQNVIPLRLNDVEKTAPNLIGPGKALGSERTAKGIFACFIKSASSQIGIIWKSALYKYGKQKRSSTALFRANLPEPQETLEHLLGEPLVSFEVQIGPDVAELVEPSTLEGSSAAAIADEETPRTVDIGIPFPGDKIQSQPDHPQSPALIPTPEPEWLAPQHCTSEEAYLQVVRSMDDHDLIDLDEVTRQWLAALQPPTKNIQTR